jgi:predicted aspartyl protease
MIPYNKRLSPPAPFLTITIVNPYQLEKRVELPALLDTGSDVTALPIRIVTELGLEVQRTIAVSGMDDEPIPTPVYVTNLEVEGNRMERVDVVEWEDNFVVLGRDILNEFYIILDGQMKQFEIRAM